MKVILSSIIKNRAYKCCFVSFIITFLLLFTGDQIIKLHRNIQMEQGALSSRRESDGAANHVIMDGVSGYVGASSVYAKYLSDGYIHITGRNSSDSVKWKKICVTHLLPGHYTLPAITDSKDDHLKLQYGYVDATGKNNWYYVWNTEEKMTITEPVDVTLFIRVEGNSVIDATVRPAIYKDD